MGLDKDGLLGDAEHNGYSGKPIDWFTQPANETIYDPHTGKVSTIIDTGTLSVVEYFIQQAQMTSTDVVLLLVGTNDVRLGDNAETMLKDIQVLLDQIVNSSASPFVQLMKLQPVGGDYWRETVNDRKTTNNDTIAAFNAGLEQLIADKYGALGVTLVDSGVTTATGLSSDGVHLDQTGYQMTAKAWFDSLMAAKQVVVPSAGQTTSGPTTEPTTEPTPSRSLRSRAPRQARSFAAARVTTPSTAMAGTTGSSAGMATMSSMETPGPTSSMGVWAEIRFMVGRATAHRMSFSSTPRLRARLAQGAT